MKCVFAIPRRCASRFIICTNTSSEPATASASAMQASLPDCTSMPLMSSSTVTGRRGSMNMREPGARQARTETGACCSSVSFLSRSAENTRYAVISLVSDAGSKRSSALCATSTWPLVTSPTIHALPMTGGGVRNIDRAIGVERAPIVDAYHHLLAGAQTRDARVARDRQDGMRRAHRIHVVGLAARGPLTVEALAVPARHAALVKRLHGCERHILLPEHLIRPVREAVQRLGARSGVGNGGEVRRRIGAGTVVLVVAALLGRRATGGEHHRQGGGVPPHASYTTFPATSV